MSARLKGYKVILAGQSIVVFTFLFVYELLVRYPFPYWQQIMLSFVGALLLGMNYLSYQLVTDLTDSRFIQRFILTLLYIGVLLAIITGMKLVDTKSTLYYIMMTGSTGSSLLSFIVLFYLMINDVFRERHDITYRLWGSACIYMGIGATFGLVFTLLAMVLPNEFGLVTQIDIFHFIPCYNYSFYTLAGLESPYATFSPLIKNLAAIESICSNLFIVLIVGRLLAK